MTTESGVSLSCGRPFGGLAVVSDLQSKMSLNCAPGLTCWNTCEGTVNSVFGDECTCGHERAAHQHFRAGSECALCPANGCTRYRPGKPVRTALFLFVARLRRPRVRTQYSAPEGHQPNRSQAEDARGNGSAVG